MTGEIWISAFIFLCGFSIGNFSLAAFRIWGKTIEQAVNDTISAVFYIGTFLGLITILGVLQ